MKASIKQLNELHDRLCNYFIELLDSGEKLAPGELSAIAKFLKDNEITADMTDATSPIGSLVERFVKEVNSA